MFQYVYAPFHKAQIVKKRMSNNLSHHTSPYFWPLDSLNLNPLYYYVWRVFEIATNKHSHNIKESFNAANVKEMPYMPIMPADLDLSRFLVPYLESNSFESNFLRKTY